MLSLRDVGHFYIMARPLNLAAAGLTFALSAWISYLKSFDFLAEPLFWTQLGVMLAVMAAGYWINDVYDYKIDRVNKPDKTRISAYISVKKALTVYFGFSVLTAGVVVLLPFKFQVVNYAAIAALYAYARFFKRQAVIGNLMIAGLTALVVLTGALLLHLKPPHFWAMMFGFHLTFLREVAKDVEDIRGDMTFGLRTLPILVGIRATKRVLLVGYVLLPVACNLPSLLNYWWRGDWLPGYVAVSLLLVQTPLVLMFRQLRLAHRPADFGAQSRYLKALIAGGLASIAFLA